MNLIIILAIIADRLNCGTGSVGTWFDGCKVVPKDITKIFLKSPSLKINLETDDFDDEARVLMIKRGQLVPLNDILQVADVPAANNFQTLANKRQIYISQGLVMFTVSFEANTCLVKALHNLSKKNWELLLLDSEGKLFFDNAAGFMNGFEVGSLSVNNETMNDGGSKFAMVDVTIQLTQNGTAGWNVRKSFLVDDAFYGINGVQDVRMEALDLVAAAFKVSIMSGCDGTTPVLGLTTPNFRLTDAATGASIAVTVVEDGDGEYTISGGTAGARTIQLFDLVNNVAVADILLQQFYKSNVVPVLLTA